MSTGIFPNAASTPSDVRDLVRRTFIGTFDPDAVDDATLVASELATVALRSDATQLLVVAHDGDGLLHVEIDAPVRGSIDEVAVDRWTERLLEALADEWSVEADDSQLRLRAVVPPEPTI